MGKYLQISQGKSVWGRETEPRTVLYFSLEDTLGRLQERLYQLVDAEEDPERLILQTESNGIGQGLEERIVSFIHAYPDISLIVRPLRPNFQLNRHYGRGGYDMAYASSADHERNRI